MATTATNFVLVTGSKPVLNGTAVLTPPYLDTFNPKEAMAVSQPTQVVGGSGTPTASPSVVVDRVMFDPALTSSPVIGTPPPVPEQYGNYVGNYAKNGSVLLVLSGTTPQTVNLQNTTTNSPASSAGDTAFATGNVVIFNNVGTVDLVVSPGASNPSPIPKMGGTSPTITVGAGSIVAYQYANGQTISSSACNITVTPTAGGEMAITIMGS